MKEFLICAIFPVCVIIAICVLANYSMSVTCKRQWENSGFQSRYSFVTDCMISRDGVTWIPADSYREVR